MAVQAEDRFLTAEEVAGYLGCNERTVRRAMAAGRLPCAPRETPRQPYKVALSVLRERWKDRVQLEQANDCEEQGG